MATVLIAEDDARQGDLVMSILRSEGHEVIGVEDGTQTIENIRARPPEVAVLDVMMPGLNGHDVCRIINHEKLDVAVLMLTALGETDDIINSAFGYDYDGIERSVDMHVVSLRRKLSEAGWTGSIDTVHGLGYTVNVPERG